MKHVAIIVGGYHDFDYNDYNSVTKLIASSITEWTEVSDEQFELLKRAQSYDYHNRFTLIERPVDEPAYVRKTVDDYVKWAKAEEDKKAKEKQKAAEAALAKKLKREAKTLADKRKLLDKLKEELGE